MTAKELFEEIGYEEITEVVSLSCVKCYINYKSLNIIYFDYDKTVEKHAGEAGFSHKYYRVHINSKELQAINKQIEELGWNK